MRPFSNVGRIMRLALLLVCLVHNMAKTAGVESQTWCERFRDKGNLFFSLKCECHGM